MAGGRGQASWRLDQSSQANRARTPRSRNGRGGIRARVIYFTQVSYYALGVSEPMPQRSSFLAAYYRAFTGHELEEAAATAFRARMIASEEDR